MKLNWNFLGGGGCKTKNLPWGKYGYFLELHILHTKLSDCCFFTDILSMCYVLVASAFSVEKYHLVLKISMTIRVKVQTFSTIYNMQWSIRGSIFYPFN